MSFVAGEVATGVEGLRHRWPGATLIHAPDSTQGLVLRAFGGLGASGPPTLLLQGTNFQLKVWKALLEIAPGEVTSYGALARSIGAPSASRAVGAAVGANSIAFLIPCHRVIRGSGALGGYRWGTERKQAILAWEGARALAGRGRASAS